MNRFSMSIDDSKTHASSWSRQETLVHQAAWLAHLNNGCPMGHSTKRHLDLNATLSALPILLAQLALEDLAVSILGQLRDKFDRPRFLIAGQMLPAEIIHFLLSYLHARTQCNNRLDTFTPQWVGNTDHCDFIDPRMLEQDLLYFPWVNIIAATNDHI